MTAGRMFVDPGEEPPAAAPPLPKRRASDDISVTEKLQQRGLLSLVQGVCSRDGMDIVEVLEKDKKTGRRSRSQPVADCRGRVLSEVKKLRGWSYKYIGDLFEMDHTSVISAIAKAVGNLQVISGVPPEGLQGNGVEASDYLGSTGAEPGLNRRVTGEQPVSSSRALASLARQICSESSSAVSSLSQSFSAVEASGLSLNAGARDPEATAAAATVKVKHQESGGEDAQGVESGDGAGGHPSLAVRAGEQGGSVGAHEAALRGPGGGRLPQAKAAPDGGLGASNGSPVRASSSPSEADRSRPPACEQRQVRAADEAELNGAEDDRQGQDHAGVSSIGGDSNGARSRGPVVAGGRHESGEDCGAGVPAGTEQAALLTELRRHPIFALLDLQHNVGLGMTQVLAGKKVEWVIQAIADYAAGNSVPGLTPQTIQRGLAGYIRNSRAPKVIDAPAGRQEPAMAKGIDYRELKPEKKAEQAKAAMPADVARMAKLIAGLGRGMK